MAAWKDVLDDKTPTDWWDILVILTIAFSELLKCFYTKYRALYSYEAQSNDLKVVSTGDGGLNELSEDLNSGKIMYAFVRVHDTKTSLTKFLLINWQVWFQFNIFQFNFLKLNVRHSLCEIRYQYLELCCLYAQKISMALLIYLCRNEYACTEYIHTI